MWWSIRELTPEDKIQIRLALKKARYWLVIPVFAILIFSHFVRALRWRLLIGSLGYHPSRANTFFAVMIGYLANQAVPRLGEVLKCTVLARYEKVPADKLVGTIILERLIDAICLLIVFGITLIIQPGLYSQLVDTFFNSDTASEEKKPWAQIILLVIFLLAVIAVITWMIVKKKTVKDVFLIIKNIGKRVWQGISAVQHLKKRGSFILLTILLWSFLFMSTESKTMRGKDKKEL